MLASLADSMIVMSHAEFRLSQFLLLQFRGTLYEPVQEYKDSSGVRKVKKSDLVFACWVRNSRIFPATCDEYGNGRLGP
jgi:hypothetical protein